MTSLLARPHLGSIDPQTAWRRLLVIPVALFEFGLAVAAATQPRLAFTFILAGAIGILALIKPVPVLVLAFPLSFAYWRVGPAAIDMSITDAVTILGTLAAAPHVPWKSNRLRSVLLLFAFYVAACGVSVLANPSVTAVGELGHRVLMVVGPIMIGSALANLGKARLALRAFLLAAAVVAVLALASSLANGLAPAYPLGMHKNAIGAHFASALLILLVAAPRVGLPRWLNVGLALLLFAGLLASQSRGAALALVAASAFYLLRSRNRTLARAAPIVLVLSLILLTFAIASFSSSQEDAQNQSFNSFNSRIEGYVYAIDNAWKPHIQFGSGPKWFRLQGFDSGPHNMIVSELSETGLMGTALLAIFLGGIIRMLWRARSDLGDAALLILVERLLDSMLGILWVAGTGTVPWLMVGLAVGDADQRDEVELEQPHLVAISPAR